MSLNANVKHLVRTFGDEVVLQSIQRKCLCMAHLNASKHTIAAMMHRGVAIAGYNPNAELEAFIWKYGIIGLQQPIHVSPQAEANVAAAVMRAPNVELTPNDYKN